MSCSPHYDSGRTFPAAVWLLSVFSLLVVGLCSPGWSEEKAADKWWSKVFKPKVPEQKWTPEEIAKNPEGYLVYADAQIENQINERQARLQGVAKRRADFEAKAAPMIENLKDVENIQNRLSTAMRRAEDEDRWPVKFGGRSFDKETADAILASAKKYMEERQPLATSYQEAVNRLKNNEDYLQNEIRKLTQLREKNALDLERVRLNKGMAELEELKKTDAQLTSFSHVLADMSEETLPVVPAGKSGAERVSIDELLQQRKSK